MATLQISLTDGEQTHELTEETTTIGRLPDNMIAIDDASVSSHHARIILREGRYELEDLDSTNGTFVNGQRLNQTALNDGMRLQFGQVEVAFSSELGGESLPLPEAEEIDVKVADQTRRPGDFANSSPFRRRSGKKDGVEKMIMAFAVLAWLAGFTALYMACSIAPPAA